MRREVRGEDSDTVANNGLWIKPRRWDFPKSKEEDEEEERVKLNEKDKWGFKVGEEQQL